MSSPNSCASASLLLFSTSVLLCSTRALRFVSFRVALRCVAFVELSRARVVRAGREARTRGGAGARPARVLRGAGARASLSLVYTSAFCRRRILNSEFCDRHRQRHLLLRCPVIRSMSHRSHTVQITMYCTRAYASMSIDRTVDAASRCSLCAARGPRRTPEPLGALVRPQQSQGSASGTSLLFSSLPVSSLLSSYLSARNSDAYVSDTQLKS